MNAKNRRLLEKVFARPVPPDIPWRDIERLFKAVGAEVEEREGSRVAVIMEGRVHIFHRPHPSPNTDKGAVAAVRKVLQENGITP